MKKLAHPLTALATTLACALGAPPAHAQSRVFVAAQGSDANPCTFALPCRTFQHAHDTVAAGGEIDVLDPAGYGALIISKAISIQGHGFAGISVASGGTGITIAAGNDKISLRGLLIDGAGVGVTGIWFKTGASLDVQDCVLRDFAQIGIDFAPATTSSLAISNTLVSDSLVGIAVVPHGSAAIAGVLNHVEVDGNSLIGINVVGNLTSGAIKVTISDSLVANGGNMGIDSTSVGGGMTEVMVRNSTVANNAVGLEAAGASGTLRVTRSTITGNAFGFAIVNSGTLVSYGDNNLDGNGADGGATTTIGYH